MTFPIPDIALAQHIAVLGKTGSGKTSTAKLAVEHVVKQEARVCILDPIKSDWWGLTSSANGERAGLPFHILGGPRGHVALHPSAGKAVGEIVASGELPLSIIDMANFNPGGQAQFFVDFAPTLLRRMRGVVYLVIEEAHLFAPKERSGIGAENMSIHWAKMLATAGRSKGVRLIVVTQRTQALHNALLGSCDTMIAHRLTAPADQEPVIKWLKANTDKVTVEKVAASLSSLPTGSGWLCSGEAKVFELVRFPRISTYDNTATPTGKGIDHDVKTAAVDQEKLRTIIGTAVKEAEANDPRALKAEVARLSAELRRASAAPTPSTVGQKSEAAALKERERIFAAGVKQGREEAQTEFAARVATFQAAVTDANQAINPLLLQLRKDVMHADDVFQSHIRNLTKSVPATSIKNLPATAASPPALPSPVQPARPKPPALVPTITREATGLPGNQQRVLDSLQTWQRMGHRAPSNAQVAWLANYSPTSTSYTNPRGALKSSGLVEYPSPDRVALTDQGAHLAGQIDLGGDLLAYVLNQLPGNERRVLEAVVAAYPNADSNDAVAERANYSASSTSYTNPRGSLKSKELITYPAGGMVRAVDWLFEGGR
jgi:hypothetical protein